MGLMAKKTGSSFPLIEEGNHQAVCYGVVDLGTQDIIWQGQVKQRHQVLIMWELPYVRAEMEKDGQKVDVCRVISRTYSLMLSDKSALLADLNSWRGKALTEIEREGFDIFTVVKANCLLQVIHIEKDGKQYANIASIASLPKGMPKREAENPILKYSMEDNGFDFPEGLYDWAKDKIKKSLEYTTFIDNHATPAELKNSGENPDYDPNYQPPQDGIPF